MSRRSLIREYIKLSHLPNLNLRHKSRKRMDEIVNELEIFYLDGNFILSGGVQVTLSVIDHSADGDRDKFIELEKGKLKRKGYPAESWIKSARIIKRFEKRYGVCRDKAARSQQDNFSVNLMWLSDAIMANSSNKIANLLLRQLVKSVACRLQQVSSFRF